MKLVLFTFVAAFMSTAYTLAGAQSGNNLWAAQTVETAGPQCRLPESISHQEFLTLDAAAKADVCMVAPADGYQKSAIGGHARVHMDGKYGKGWAGYFSVDCFGQAGAIGGECGAIYARVEPRGDYPLWHFAMHAECRNRGANPGLCGGLNIELRDHFKDLFGVPSTGTYYGINIQPGDGMTGVRGIQFQNGSSYAYTIDHGGGFEQVGNTDGTPFCWKYEAQTQQLLLVRGCSLVGAQVAHVIDLNWRPSLPQYVPGKKY